MRRAAIAFLLILIGLALWFGYQTFHVVSAVRETTGKIQPTMTDEPTITIPPLDGNHRINVLVLGSDNDKKKEETHPLTQSMIVVSIDPVHYHVAMMSIPRDFWVPIEGHGWGKIDLAHKYGGVTLARATVHKLFGIPIDYYAWVGLDGFVKVIDTFGGITVDVPQPILDDSYPNDMDSQDPYGYRRVFLPAGWQHMNGTQALEYVRSRHGDYFGDFGRSHRQQEVLLQLDHKVNAMSVVLNLPQLVDALKDSVRTDLTLPQIYELEQWSHHISPANVQQVVLQPPTYSYYSFSKDGQSIVVPRWARIRALVRQLFAPIGATRPRIVPTPPPTSTPTAAPHATPTRTPAPRVRPTAPPTATGTPTPTATPAVPTMTHLTARALYVEGGNIFLMGKDGHAQQLTFTGDAAMPKMSPNGKQVVFVRFRGDGNASDLWILDLHSRRERAITHDARASDVRNELWAAWPSWAPDGKTIFFSWDRQKLAQPPSDARPVALALWQIGSDGSNPVQLTRPVIGASGDTEGIYRPGQNQILFVKWSYLPSSFQPYSQLALLDRATGRVTLLTPVGGRVIQPAWNNNGTDVVFIRQSPSGVDQVAEAPVTVRKGVPALGARTVLAQGQVAQPSFTPDGRWVSFLRPQDNGFVMYIIRSNGQGPALRVTQIPNDIDARWHPAWLP